MVTESKEQNFTQFAVARGYPSDYDVLEHGDLSPSGHVSKRARKAMQERQSDRARRNLIAHDEYNKAIIAGDVKDPSGEITKEKLLTRKQQAVDATTQSKKDGLERQIEVIEGLGKMSHLPSGKLKVGYQRTVDFYKEELAKLETKQPAPPEAPRGEAPKETTMKKAPTTMAKLRSINTNRSPAAVASDKKQRHKNIIKPTDTEAVKRWVKDPGTGDIVGVDTPEKARVKRRRVKRTQTERGMAQDKRQSNKDKITRTSPRLKAWRKNPGSMDVEGIDTPSISRRTPRISGGKGGRITPKRPRLKR